MGLVSKALKKAFNIIGYDISKKKIDFQSDLYKKLFSEESLKKKRFYNIGAGNFFHPYWTNIDYSTDWYGSVQTKDFINYNLLDLKPLPIEDNIAETVYTSHTIEHITNEATLNLFKESYRVLKKNGILRITTPNFLLNYYSLKFNDLDFYYWKEWYSSNKDMEKLGFLKPMNEFNVEECFQNHVATQTLKLYKYGKPESKISGKEFKKKILNKGIESLDEITALCDLDIHVKHIGNHINWWTINKIEEFLKKAGFSEIIISGYGQSISPILRNTSLFDKTHPKISLYVEAIKN